MPSARLHPRCITNVRQRIVRPDQKTAATPATRPRLCSRLPTMPSNLSNALINQLDERIDRLRRDRAGTRIEREPRHLVLGRHDALENRHEALQVEKLIERRRYVG